MNIYIYTDESGVFDYVHNDFFIFGGVIFFSKQAKDIANRKYIHAEKTIKDINANGGELKASIISNKNKGKLFRSLNGVKKFAVVIDQSKVHKKIFKYKKSKQRYLDYAYKMLIKNVLKDLAQSGSICLDSIEELNIYCDEHTTATDGRYELREAILGELKEGTFNYKWNRFYEPICKNMKDVKLSFCDSKSKALIRAADIVANKVYCHVVSGNTKEIKKKVKLFYLP